MAFRTILVLLLSLVCGTSAAVGAFFLMNRPQAPVEVAPKTTSILVAGVDISRGTSLKPEFVKTQEWPEALVPPGAIQEIEKVDGLVALTGFVPGEPVLQSRVAEGTLGAASLVEVGMRGFTIETPTSSSGVAGFILPGNRVDVLLTVTRGMDDVTGGGGTWTLLQNVEILGADQRLDQRDGKASPTRSVTLLVTPDMAAKLTLAATMGTLNLTLRNDADDKIAETEPITMREIRFLQEAMLAKTKFGVADAKAKAKEEKAQEEKAEQPPVNVVLNGNGRREPPLEILALRGGSASLIRINNVKRRSPSGTEE